MNGQDKGGGLREVGVYFLEFCDCHFLGGPGSRSTLQHEDDASAHPMMRVEVSVSHQTEQDEASESRFKEEI